MKSLTYSQVPGPSSNPTCLERASLTHQFPLPPPAHHVCHPHSPDHRAPDSCYCASFP